MINLKAVFADKFFAACLAAPVLLLMAFAGLHEWEFRSGRVFVFPVQKPEGQAPALSKTFFSGWRLEYQADYGLPEGEPGAGDSADKISFKKQAGSRPVFLCLEPAEKRHLSLRAAGCSGYFIKGRLAPVLEGRSHAFRFQAKKLQRFYLSEKQARPAEKLFSRAEKKEIIVSVTKRGAATLRDMLIEGRSFKSQLASKP